MIMLFDLLDCKFAPKYKRLIFCFGCWQKKQSLIGLYNYQRFFQSLVSSAKAITIRHVFNGYYRSVVEEATDGF